MGEKTTKETHAYTPGLKVKKGMKIKKTRVLPIDGEVIVKIGDKVDFETIVARSSILGKPYIIKAYEILGVPPEVLPKLMVKKVGNVVEEGEIIAKYTPFWGLIKKYVYSPIKGIIESVSDITGQIILREMPYPIEINAYIPGEVKKIIPKRGVEIECFGAFIQGIFGIGGEKNGEICVIVDSPNDVLEENMIKNKHKGKIIVGGSLVTLDALKKAAHIGVTGIVVGGIKGQTITDFLGYEIGVAITGNEKINTTLIITEGFGKMSMSKRVFNILKEFDGYKVAINGATQIRAGVMRPEIIIPNEKYLSEVSNKIIELSKGMKPETLVRIISEPYFGKIGIITRLPVHLQKIETESMVRVVEVKLDIGKVIVPRANVEILEE